LCGVEFANDVVGGLESQIDNFFGGIGVKFNDPKKPKSKQVGVGSNEKYMDT